MSDTDPIQPQSPAPEPASAPAPQAAPAAPQVDYSEIESRLTAKFDEQYGGRIKDFQRMLNERDEQIRQLQAASMSEEEQEQLAIREQMERMEALEAENWLYQKAMENRQAAELFQQILAFDDPEEQFAFLADLASRLGESPQEPEVPQVPDTDPNNPPINDFANQDVLVLPDGRRMTNAMIDDLLKQMPVGSWPSR